VTKRFVHTTDAPEPAGHYSQAVVAGNLVYVSGSGPFNPQTHSIVGTTIEEQTEQTLKNVSVILDSAGSSIKDVVKVTVYLKDMRDFEHMNSAYARFFGATKPARTTIQAALFGEGRLIVLDAIAVRTR
jgi:2-iminobutanoate/2-iminopropanoate deaminase